MNAKETAKVLLLFAVMVIFLAIGLLFRMGSPVNVHMTKCECGSSHYNSVEKESELIPTPHFHLGRLGDLNTISHHPPLSANSTITSKTQGRRIAASNTRFLSYQSPGNGWNNQRIALENALVLAKLLNRTLVVHPLAPHELGSKLKIGNHYGYVAYNMLNKSNLLPLSQFMDLDLLSQVIPVVEVTSSHTQFIKDYSHLSWKNICHSPGYGYWVDQVPQSSEEVDLLTKQKFSSLGRVWRERCPEEKERAEQSDGLPIVRFVSDLVNSNLNLAEMLYFEQGTLFGMQIRFMSQEKALEAQHWVVDHVRYNKDIWMRVRKVAERMGGRHGYNAIQVRRKMHMDSKLHQSFWIERMLERNFSKAVPVYVATNDLDDLEWFRPFIKEDFKLYFALNFTDILDFSDIGESLRNDYLGIHEQCLCEDALEFIPSPASTFNAFILRHRGEVKMKDGLMMETLHTYWAAHQTTKQS